MHRTEGTPLSWPCSGFHRNTLVCSVAMETAATVTLLSPRRLNLTLSFPPGDSVIVQEWGETLDIVMILS